MNTRADSATVVAPPIHPRWPHLHAVTAIAGRDTLATALVLLVATLVWLPRRSGPIDLRWDGSVYYVLGTSLAEGKGYKLLNEPGEIDAVQYPPLLPAIVAVHQLMLGTSNPTIVGRALRLSSFAVFLAYALVSLRLLRAYLPRKLALLGALMAVLCLHAWFLSDALYPEVWFSAATLLFLIAMRKPGGFGRGAATYGFALMSYGLRTIGITAFVVWVIDSLVRRQFRQAIARAVLALVPIVAWEGYVMSVEQSSAYAHPAYAYQRAPYVFHNVSYSTNIALRDPFAPEKGDARIVRRVVRNLTDIPSSLGEMLIIARGYLQMILHAVFGNSSLAHTLITWSLFALLSAFGGLLVIGGGSVLLRHGHWTVPAYLFFYLGAMCLAPFPGQYLRYLMPVAPLLSLCALTFLYGDDRRLRRSSENASLRARWGPPSLILGPVLAVQAVLTLSVFVREFRPAQYVDAAGEPISQRLFFYSEDDRGFDQAIDFLRAHASSDSVVATGSAHWVYLRTGLKAILPPFETSVIRAERLLEDVPVDYLIVGRDVEGTERYTGPVVLTFTERWTRVFASDAGGWSVFRRRSPRLRPNIS